MSEGGKVAVQEDDEFVSASGARALKKRGRELERLLGKKTMEVEILKEGIKIAREKTDIAHAVALRGGFPVKRVAEAFDVARPSPASGVELKRELSQHRVCVLLSISYLNSRYESHVGSARCLAHFEP